MQRPLQDIFLCITENRYFSPHYQRRVTFESIAWYFSHLFNRLDAFIPIIYFTAVTLAIYSLSFCCFSFFYVCSFTMPSYLFSSFLGFSTFLYFIIDAFDFFSRECSDPNGLPHSPGFLPPPSHCTRASPPLSLYAASYFPRATRQPLTAFPSLYFYHSQPLISHLASTDTDHRLRGILRFHQ